MLGLVRQHCAGCRRLGRIARNALLVAFADALIVILGWMLWAAPVGVFALVLVMCASIGGEVLGMLGA